MRLVILGGPGAGKGTQAELLQSRLKIVWISTGDILRAAISAQDSDGESQTELGRLAQHYVAQGELVPDETMIQFIRQRLKRADVKNGWLLEGYPRTAFQAEELDFLLDDLNQQLDYAILLETPDSILMERSLSHARQDDTPATIQRRIDLYQERTIPLLEYYEMRDRLLRIRGDQPIERVQQDILTGLGVTI